MRTLAHTIAARLTYANVVASLALFVALGGTSYAALTITGANVRDGSLTGADLKNGSIGSNKLQSKIVSARGRSGAPGRPGATGPHGATGAQGATGSAGPDGPRVPSDAYHLFRQGFGDPIRSLTLPAGRYAVVAHIALYNSSTASLAMPCDLYASQDSDPSHRDGSTTAVPASSELQIALTTVLDLPSGGAVTMDCLPTTGGTTGRLSIVATQVAAIHD